MDRNTAVKVLSAIGLGGGALYMANRLRRGSTSDKADKIGTSESLPSTAPIVTDMQLKLVQIFFRHGARIPLRNLEELEQVYYDPRFLLYQLPYTDIPIHVQSIHGGPRPPSPMDKRYGHVIFKGGVTAGLLTALGQDQLYCLGRQLRKDYPTIMEETFDPKHVWIQSTNIQRCIDSLKCLLAGMYGRKSFTEPVVIRVSPFKEETLHPNLRSCPTLRAMEMRVQEREADIPGVSVTSNKLNCILGMSGRQDLMTWRDHLAARKAHGLALPQFLKDLERDIEASATNLLLNYMSGLPEDQPHSLRLTVGRALHHVQTNIDKHVSDPTNTMRLALYSCHDSTITPLLTAINCFDDQWPPYAANLRFELYQDKKGSYWVCIKYLNQVLKIGSGRKEVVSLNEFKKILSPYVIDRKDYMSQCSLSQAFWDALDDAVEDVESPVPGNM